MSSVPLSWVIVWGSTQVVGGVMAIGLRLIDVDPTPVHGFMLLASGAFMAVLAMRLYRDAHAWNQTATAHDKNATHQAKNPTAKIEPILN